MFMSSSKNKHLFVAKLGNRCFSVVSIRHVGAHPDELQHGVSIQSSINPFSLPPVDATLRIYYFPA